MKKDLAVLLVDFAAFYSRKRGLKRHFVTSGFHDENDKKHDEKNIKHDEENGVHDVSVQVHNDRIMIQKYFRDRFPAVEFFVGYAGSKDIKKLKMDRGIKLEFIQDVLEEIKTVGYMYTYVLPVSDREAIGYEELFGEIEERMSFGCFSDIIFVETDDAKYVSGDKEYVNLGRFADRLVEVMR